MHIAQRGVGDGVVDGIGVLFQIAAGRFGQVLRLQRFDHHAGDVLHDEIFRFGQVARVLGGEQKLQRVGHV